MSRIPTRDLRETQAFNAFMFAPAINGAVGRRAVLDAPAARAATRPAGQDLGRPVPPERLISHVKRLRGIFGRSDPPAANLDNLFAVPSAAITLEAATGFTPTGVASVCYRQAEGGAFADAQRDIQELLDARRGSEGRTRRPTTSATPGWSAARDPTDLASLVNDVHAVNSTLENVGFGPSLLCSLVMFADQRRPSRRAGLPLQAGHVLPVRPDRRQASVTTRSSSRCKGCSSARSPDRATTCRAGWRSSTPPVSE